MNGERRSTFNEILYEALKQEKTLIKPCPFCGGDARIMDMGYPHWIYCTKCGAKVHGGTSDVKDSINAWNRRA